MKRQELIALMPAGDRAAELDGLTVVRTEGYAAILGPGRSGLLPLGRRRALSDAAGRARLLETLLPHGCVIPVLPGLSVGVQEIRGLVAANLPLIDHLAERLAGRVQYQVTVRWRRTEALAHFGQLTSNGELSDGIERLSDTLREDFSKRLGPLGEVIALPVAGDVLSNTALLISVGSELALDRVVEDIDSMWSEGFSIRMVGPYPGVSFASLSFRRVEQRAVEIARAALGVSPQAGREGLRAARRSALMRATPGERETLRRQAELVEAGLRLPKDVDGPLFLGRVWSEDRSTAYLENVAAA